mgnify:CR=1 FL=1
MTERTYTQSDLEALRERCAKLERELAECRVLAIRGSYDAPGFDGCVMAELKAIRALPSPRVKG